MQFSLLNRILSPDSRYAIYLDIKDTRSRLKLHKLREVRGLQGNPAKLAVIDHVEQRLGRSLLQATPLAEPRR